MLIVKMSWFIVHTSVINIWQEVSDCKIWFIYHSNLKVELRVIKEMFYRKQTYTSHNCAIEHDCPSTIWTTTIGGLKILKNNGNICLTMVMNTVSSFKSCFITFVPNGAFIARATILVPWVRYIGVLGQSPHGQSSPPSWHTPVPKTSSRHVFKTSKTLNQKTSIGHKIKRLDD